MCKNYSKEPTAFKFKGQEMYEDGMFFRNVGNQRPMHKTYTLNISSV